MRKVHPNANAPESPKPTVCVNNNEVEVLTVWRKSLLFNGNGFTVFDGKGNLRFRVDNYASENKGEIVLMDAAGMPLVTIRRKKLSLADQWMIYEGEELTNPRFSVKKHVNLLNSKSLAHLTPCCSPKSAASRNSNGKTNSPKSCSSSSSSNNDNTNSPKSSSSSSTNSPKSSSTTTTTKVYEIEGSYTQRCCTLYDDKRQPLAEIRRKESANGIAFGLDVFRLIVQPNFDANIAMAIVILLEQMFGSKGSLIRGL